MCTHKRKFKRIIAENEDNALVGYYFSILYCEKCGELKEVNRRFY